MARLGVAREGEGLQTDEDENLFLGSTRRR